MAGMAADYSGLVTRLNRAVTGDLDLRGAGLERDQGNVVVMLIVVFELGPRVDEFHCPFDHRLAVSCLGREPKALERVRHRSSEGVARGVADCEAHRQLPSSLRTGS